MNSEALVCGVCATPNLAPFLPLGTLQREKFTTVLLRCSHCGVLADEVSLRYLQNNEHSFSDFQASAVQKVYAKDLDMTAIEQEVLNRLPLAASLADRLHKENRAACYDFGCGSGLLACALAQHFEHVYATDLDLSLAEAIGEGIGAPLHFASFEELAPESIDMVVAWHVVEHLSHPGEFFSNCLRVLKAGGQIAMQVPLPMPQYLEDDHLWFLTIEAAGWVRSHFGYWNVDYAVDEQNQFITYFFTK